VLVGQIQSNQASTAGTVGELLSLQKQFAAAAAGWTADIQFLKQKFNSLPKPSN